jgi:outer membrane protein assembly factor BamA
MNLRWTLTALLGTVFRRAWITAFAATALVLTANAAQAGTTVATGALQMDQERGLPVVPGDLADPVEEEVDEPDDDGKKRGEFVIAPLPSRSPLVGWTIALPAMYIYKPKSTVEDDKPWVSGLAGFYTENESYGGGLFHKMSIGGDSWRLLGALFSAQINYDYYGIGGSDESSIPIRQTVSLGLAEALREVFFDKFFLGLKTVYSQTEASTTIPTDVILPGSDPIELASDYALFSIAPRLQYDTRDSEFYPTTGFFIDGTVGLSSENLGSDNTFQKYTAKVNHYRPIRSFGVLASRLVFEYVGGDVPFFLYPAYGTDVDLRGYQTGTYRDRFLFSGQIEYRHRFTPRLGAVVFAGIGTVAPEFGEWDTSLPSAGGGVRYVVANENDVSIRLDYAWGRDDQQFYVGIGESF